MDMGLKFFDLFAGIGGFRLGMERAGHECVGSCEWDKYARETYKCRFGSYPEYNDAKEMQTDTLPQFDVLCAGFPCQAFSHAGKRRGFEDTRGTVFFEIARIAKDKRPRYIFLENVTGLLTHDKGRTFRTIISTLDEMGYDAEWQVLNSKYFVPQNRERIFIIGHLRGTSTRQVFPLGESIRSDNRKIKKIIGYSQCASIYDKDGLMCTLAACTHGYALGMVYLANSNANMKQRIQSRDKTWTLTNNSGDFGLFDPNHSNECVEYNLKYEYDTPGECVCGGNPRIVRRLTPLECERLQGFPDNWTIGSDTQRYKQCGNAVTVPVVEYIAKEIHIG